MAADVYAQLALTAARARHLPMFVTWRVAQHLVRRAAHVPLTTPYLRVALTRKNLRDSCIFPAAA